MACLVDSLTFEAGAHFTHNPMFLDLQATLASDCVRQSVPYVLAQGHDQQYEPPFQGQAQPSMSRGNTDLLVQDATLQAELRQLSPLKNTKVSELETFYNTQSATIMTHRSDALVALQQKCLSPSQLIHEGNAINSYYDEQQSHLTHRISKSLALLKCMLPAELAQPGGMTKKTKVRSLNSHAVAIMTEWYENHLANPYPSIMDKEEMAHRGNISLSQVKAWFANKRNRSSNTKPKRELHKLQKQLKGICAQLQSNTPVNYGNLDLGQNYMAVLDNISTMVTNKTSDYQGYGTIMGDLAH